MDSIKPSHFRTLGLYTLDIILIPAYIYWGGGLVARGGGGEVRRNSVGIGMG